MVNIKTYISLFSSSGVGCYGFLTEGYECIATNELIERRLDVQKANNKCKYESGYISGDITEEKVVNKLYKEIDYWNKNHNIKDVDVIIATPPCQGMSVANHKKNDDEIIRNSLVVESIKIVKKISPKFFIFENVASFMKTVCTDVDGYDKPISDAIDNNLESNYIITSKVINLKNYGSNSSRTRTIVIGVRKDLSDYIMPEELFPDYVPEKTLRESIGHLESFNNFHEFSDNDIYHFFRKYSPHMRPWIETITEGQSAFDNTEIERIPHQIINGKIVINKNKNGDKYTRQSWDKVAACIHTRNDQLASQSTIHPVDDRVLSIRELMILMSVPSSFKWTSTPIDILNKYTIKEKIKFLKENEINIRQSLGEAVPTMVFNNIAKKISSFLSKKNLNHREIKNEVDRYSLEIKDNLIEYIIKNKDLLNLSTISEIVEISNAKRVEYSAYYTNKKLLHIVYDQLPDFDEKEINIMEPSVGSGNFLPIIFSKYQSNQKVNLDLVDIDKDAIDILKVLIKLMNVPDNFNINFYSENYLNLKINKNYDLILGNPPFTVINKLYIKKLDEKFENNSNNLSAYFLEKSINNSRYISLIMPKNVLNTPGYNDTREFINDYRIESIIDFGESGFKGVLVETILININKDKGKGKTLVKSVPRKTSELITQNYFTSNDLPYWIIYRNEKFDNFIQKLELDIFTTFRDRQITNKLINGSGEIRVLKSRNINDDGTEILDIDNYDAYTRTEKIEDLAVYKYLNDPDVYMTPNMTYNSRLMKKPLGMITNGSIALLKLNKEITFSKEDSKFISTNEYRDFLRIARNYQTRSLNIDNNSIYFFGKRKE